MKQPLVGISGIKPRAPKPEGNSKPSRGELHALDREYRIRRNEALELKNRREIILLAKARGELILRDLVEKQAAFLLVATRQKMLDVPRAYAGRLVGLTDPHEAAQILRATMIECLDELKDLPARVTDASWLERVGEEQQGGGGGKARGGPDAPPAARIARIGEFAGRRPENFARRGPWRALIKARLC
jgi:hypothetical protein